MTGVSLRSIPAGYAHVKWTPWEQIIKGVIMKICIIGNGKLSNSIFIGLQGEYNTIKWELFDKKINEKIIAIHAGSGRQFEECLDYCNKTGSILLELSTGENISKYKIECPIIICPNTAIPILKMMNILKNNGKTFCDYRVRIIESHQKDKNTVAGTAFEIAKALNVDTKRIESIRNIKDQLEIGIPEDYLNLHAYHKIIIEDKGSEIIIQLKVLGHDAYVQGVGKLIDLIHNKNLGNKIYNIIDII